MSGRRGWVPSPRRSPKTATIVFHERNPTFLESKMARHAKAQSEPPAHLTGLALTFWTETQAVYEISDPAGLRLLRLACESLMTAETARLAIAAEGLTYTDRFGAPRPRPEVAMQRDAMTTFRGLVRELRLDPVGDPK